MVSYTSLQAGFGFSARAATLVAAAIGAASAQAHPSASGTASDVMPPPPALPAVADESAEGPVVIDDGGIVVAPFAFLNGGSIIASVQASAAADGGGLVTSYGIDGMSLVGGAVLANDALAVEGAFTLDAFMGTQSWISFTANALIEGAGQRRCGARVLVRTAPDDPIRFTIATESVLRVTGDRAATPGTSWWGIMPVTGEFRQVPGGEARLTPGTYELTIVFDVIATAEVDLTFHFDEPLEGDLDSDGWIGPRDLASLLADWGANDCGYAADLTNDCVVNADDVAALMQLWMTADDQ